MPFGGAPSFEMDSIISKRTKTLTSKETKAGPKEESRTPIKNLVISFGLALVILVVVFAGMKFFG